MNIFDTRRIMNESAVAAVNVTPHVFYGDLNESHFNEVSYLLGEPLYEAVQTVSIGQELLVEAAVANDVDKLEVLSEGVFSTVVEKVKKFFKDAKAFVMGIIEKIKLYLKGMTGNVNKWLKEVKPYVDKNLANSKDFTVEGHQWNEGAIGEVMDKALKISKDVVQADTMAAKMKKDVDSLKAAISANKSNTDAITLDGYKGDPKEYETTQKQEFKAKYEAILGYKYTEYKETLTKKARGAEKVTLKDLPIGTMLAFIEKSSDKIEAIKSSYEKLETTINKAISTVEGLPEIDLSTIKSEDKNRTAIAEAVSEMAARHSTDLAIIKESLDVTNGLKNLAIALTRECTQEYMTILSKFARFKPNKK